MGTYKNNTGFRQSIARDGVEYNVEDGGTVEIPDEDTTFDGRPGWSKSQVKSPDVTVDPPAEPTPAVEQPPAPAPAPSA